MSTLLASVDLASFGFARIVSANYLPATAPSGSS
jgi:hypothetical protein